MNTNTKYWQFTWDTNVNQKKLPRIPDLIQFLDGISETGVFQEERGLKAAKIHYQGNMTLIGARVSKMSLIRLFEARFKNVAGLTVTKIFDPAAMLAYNTKSETRVSGPYYFGTTELRNQEILEMKLKPWQRELYKLLLDIHTCKNPNHAFFKKRSILWIHDKSGGAGKSEFITWLRVAQREIIARKLSLDSVDRLLSGAITLTKSTKVDLFMFDDSRSKGKETSFEDLFEAIETIKNGYVVSCMYGKYSESIFDRPLIIFFTNRRLVDYKQSLSSDRWYPMVIQDSELYESNDIGVPLKDIKIVEEIINRRKSKAAGNDLKRRMVIEEEMDVYYKMLTEEED